MSEDIILLSSDDEFESPPPKKCKLSDKEELEVLEKLNKLKEITAARCQEKKPLFRKNHVEEASRLTIVIEGDDKRTNCNKDNDIVNLSDEEVQITETKGNTSSECLIVGSDSEPETEVTDVCKENEVNEVIDSPPPVSIAKSPEPPPDSPKPGESEEVEEEKQNGIELSDHDEKESESPPQIENNDILNRPSTSRASDAHKLLDEFLETCTKSIRGSKYEAPLVRKFPKMKNLFEKCESVHSEPHFMKMLQDYIATAKVSAPEAVVSFQRIYSHLLDNLKGDFVEVTQSDLLKIKKLEKFCRKLMKRIRILEEAELNFDDEEDSTYMQMDRFTQRLSKAYAKYCQLLKKSPYAGRLLYEKVQYVSSKHNEINRAVTKAYKNNKFPTYGDIESVIRKCVKKHKLELPEEEIKEEIKFCLKKMGNLMQMRRKKELYEVHCSLVPQTDDPASADEDLKTKLQESLREGDLKMKEMVEKYVKLQESGAQIEVSEDSDDSNYKSSESEPET